MARSMAARILDSLSVYYPLDEDSGNAKAHLYKGPTLDLTDTNTVTGAVGPSANLPKARQFTAATAERFTAGADDERHELGRHQRGFSAQAWVYADALPGTVMGIFGKDAGGAGNRSWRLILTGTNVLNTLFYNGTTQLGGTSTGAISAETWYHVVTVIDHAASYLYVNGGSVLLGQAGLPSRGANTGFTEWTNGTTPLVIGQDLASGGADRYWNGRIAQVALWQRALSRKEVLWLYNNGQGVDLRRGC